MTNEDRAIALFGTAEPVEAPILLRAGPITAELDAGNLRHIRVEGREVIRAVSFIVRDRQWGTYGPEIADLTVDQRPDGFTVRYRAEARDAEQSFGYRATIEGRPDRIVFAAEGEAAADFETNRTGFVVLHPLAGVAGEPVEIEHVDGRAVRSRFPDLIDPVQPMTGLRALSHAVAPGLNVTCRMEGDAFEMEDQRNWCDASFKAYVRPLSRPWPYTLAAGEILSQSVTLSVSGEVRPAASAAASVCEIAIGEVIGPAPAVGLGFDPSEIDATRRVLTAFGDLRPAMLVCHFDPRRGHDRATLEAMLAIAADLRAEPWLEAIVAEVDGFESEIARLGALVRSLGSPFRTVMITPAADLKSTTPGQPWPPAPPPIAFYRAARTAFPGVRLGGGVASTFTELNRKRPPREAVDVVNFTTMALVHACDDISVMQGLEALPSIARSARAIAGDRPLVVGPSAIGLRMNPYAADPIANPTNKRQVMALNDPRQRSRLGAAWALGYYANLAAEGVDSIVFGGTTGPFGIVHTTQAWPTPGFRREGEHYPIFAVVETLLRRIGTPLRTLRISHPASITGIAFQQKDFCEIYLSNLSPEYCDVKIDDQDYALPPYGTCKFITLQSQPRQRTVAT